MQTYTFEKTEDDIIGTRVGSVHPKTKGLFINETDKGYGCTAIMGDFRLPLSILSSYDFFEYYKEETQEYYRIHIVEDMLFGNPMPDPAPLKIRHKAWPGMDKAEIREEMLEERAQAIKKAIKRVHAERAREEAERLRKIQEKKDRKEVKDSFYLEFGSEEDAILAALKQEFGDDFEL